MKIRTAQATRLLTAGAAGVLIATLAVPATAATESDAAAESATETAVVADLLSDGGTVTPAGAPPLPNQASAESFVVAEAATGAVLAAKDAHGQRAPGASMKALTALALIPKLDANEVLTATKEQVNTAGQRSGLKPGGQYQVADLFHALLLASGNDAANVLLGAAPGGDAIGLSAVTAEAARLQANNTSVVNATGLDAEGQHTSAYDLALVAREGLRNADFAGYVAAPEHVAETSHGTLRWTNGNKLIGKYEGTIGVNTGGTPQSGGTYVGAVTREGRTLILTLLGAGDKVAAEAMEMFDWAFGMGSDVEPVGTLAEPVGPPATSFVALDTTADPAAASEEGAAADGEAADAEQAAADEAAAAEQTGGLGFGSEALLSLLVVVLGGIGIVVIAGRAQRRPAGPAPDVPAARHEAESSQAARAMRLEDAPSGADRRRG